MVVKINHEASEQSRGAGSQSMTTGIALQWLVILPSYIRARTIEGSVPSPSEVMVASRFIASNSACCSVSRITLELSAGQWVYLDAAARHIEDSCLLLTILFDC